MSNKSTDCFACDARARGVRVEVSPQRSFVLPHEHFIYAEFVADDRADSLVLMFVTHEVKLTGYLLRRVELAMVNRDLAWLCARDTRLRPRDPDRPFILAVTVRALDPQPKEAELK